MKLIKFIAPLIILLSSCSKDEVTLPQANPMLDLVGKIETNKSRYDPGEDVIINLFLISSDFESVNVKYKHLTTTLKEEAIIPTGNQLELVWTPPTEDFQGYSIEFEFIKDGEIVDYGSTAVDVSSDWTKFPRYGFLSKFPVLSSSTIDNYIKELNAFHINGLQYYDWHNKHHAPLRMNGTTPANTWQDIAGRNTSFNTVAEYISAARDYNIASMSYNLLYGVWDDYESDGVSKEWLIFNDPDHSNINKHDLDDNWALSDIYLTNPANRNWQNYIFQKTDTVYQNLDFDGWHIDQLGDRGTVYDYNGNKINLRLTFIPFLENLKLRFPNKKMVLNAVNQYGQLEIANTPVDFFYTEVWHPNEKYEDLAKIIMDNFNFNNEINTVIAAYVNYDKAENTGEFNEPAVLMADAVIMSFGGCHIELGEHMLGKEYFPNDNLSMSVSLKEKLIEYYDFMVANQNILRDGGNINLNSGITSNDFTMTNWSPFLGKVSSFKKEFGDKVVCHLMNFSGLNSLEWRDNLGNQQSPTIKENVTVSIPAGQVSKVTYASPDWHDGVQKELEFTISGGKCEVKIPYLEFWGILIVE